MIVHVEFLYHCSCSTCNQWWTMTDRTPKLVFCPHCRTEHTVKEIVAHAQIPKINRIEAKQDIV